MIGEWEESVSFLRRDCEMRSFPNKLSDFTHKNGLEKTTGPDVAISPAKKRALVNIFFHLGFFGDFYYW